MMLWCALPLHAAADRNVDIERFRPALDPKGFLGIHGTLPPGPWRWRIGLWTWYSRHALRIPTSTSTRSAIPHRLTSDVQFEVGLGKRVALELDLPFTMYQTSNTSAFTDGGPALASAAMGDPRITGRYRIFGKPIGSEAGRQDGAALALLTAIPIPIGSKDQYTSERQFAMDVQAIADIVALGAGAGVMVGWRGRAEGRDVGSERVRNELQYGVALRIPTFIADGLWGLVELRGSSGFRGENSNGLEGDIGALFERAGWAWRTAVGMGFVRGVGVPSVRAIMGLSYSPPNRDKDNDGVTNKRDQCPSLAEDWDGYQDDDGCLDPDNDNDLVLDVDDRCPNEEAIEGQDEDEDGCTDVAQSL